MKKQNWLYRILSLVLALLGVFCCYRLIIASAKNGYSRLLTAVVVVQSAIEPANRATWLTPDDPEAHYTRGLALVNNERLPEAVAEFRTANQLRPHHYYQWLDLGLTLDRLNDQEGAMAAVRQSVLLAPSFAQPRWQLGNLLYRQERYEEAFVELRYGAENNPTFFEPLLDLAWAAAAGDVPLMETFVKPQDAKNHLALARYFAKQGKGADALRHLKSAGAPEGDAAQLLLRQTIAALLATQQFSEAYAAWEITHRVPSGAGDKGEARILNADFMEPITQNDVGFGWQLPVTPTVKASIDPAGPLPNSRSLNFAFNGAYDPTSGLISQVVLLQPKTRYTLSFMAKTDSLVTGGPPVIIVFDGDNSGKVLGQSAPLPTATSGWGPVQVSFTSEENTRAGIVTLQRLNCRESPCPVFGRLWLGHFSISKG